MIVTVRRLSKRRASFNRKRINISVTLVSESYVILYCEKKCNM